MTLEWDGRTENVVLAPVGTGKSHFIEGLALAAIEKDPRVAWFSRGILAAAIGKSKGDGSTARTVSRICGADLIAIRDIGLLPVGEDARRGDYRIIDAACGTPGHRHGFLMATSTDTRRQPTWASPRASHRRRRACRAATRHGRGQRTLLDASGLPAVLVHATTRRRLVLSGEHAPQVQKGTTWCTHT
ncbi:ATP-binding protein [Streptomyces sp. 900105755]